MVAWHVSFTQNISNAEKKSASFEFAIISNDLSNDINELRKIFKNTSDEFENDEQFLLMIQ